MSAVSQTSSGLVEALDRISVNLCKTENPTRTSVVEAVTAEMETSPDHYEELRQFGRRLGMVLRRDDELSPDLIAEIKRQTLR